MKLAKILKTASLLSVVLIANSALAQYVSLLSFQGRYLQAHSDNGETHASNDTRHNEETWRLIPRPNDRYALMNASNGKYLSVQESNCIRANVGSPSRDWEEWYIEQVPDTTGLTHFFRFRSARTDYRGYLGTNDAGNDYSPCGGEVHYFIDDASKDPVTTARTEGPDIQRTYWTIKKESDDGGHGGPDIGSVLKTLSDVVQVAKAAAAALPQ